MVQKEGDNEQANDQEEEGTEGESGEEELEYDEEEQEEVKKIITFEAYLFSFIFTITKNHFWMVWVFTKR